MAKSSEDKYRTSNSTPLPIERFGDEPPYSTNCVASFKSVFCYMCTSPSLMEENKNIKVYNYEIKNLLSHTRLTDVTQTCLTLQLRTSVIMSDILKIFS